MGRWEETLKEIRFFEFLTEEERESSRRHRSSSPSGRARTSSEEGADRGEFVRARLGSGRGQKGIARRKEQAPGRDRCLTRTDRRGERGLLGESGASATVMAVDEVEAIRIPRDTFRRMVAEGRPAAFSSLPHRPHPREETYTSGRGGGRGDPGAREQGGDRHGGSSMVHMMGRDCPHREYFVRQIPDLGGCRLTPG